MLKTLLKTLPEDVKEDALIAACQFLAGISQRLIEVPLPASPLVALRTVLDSVGVKTVDARNQAQAEELAAIARNLGIEAFVCDLSAPAKDAAAEAIAKAKKH